MDAEDVVRDVEKDRELADGKPWHAHREGLESCSATMEQRSRPVCRIGSSYKGHRELTLKRFPEGQKQSVWSAEKGG